MKRSSSLRLIDLPSQGACFSSTAITTSLRLAGGCRPVRLLRLHSPCRPLHRFDDVLIARAPADVARQRPADLLLGWARVLGEQRSAGEHHAGRTEAALQSVLLFEPLLDRVERAAAAEPFHRCDLASVGLYGEHRAGLDR